MSGPPRNRCTRPTPVRTVSAVATGWVPLASKSAVARRWATTPCWILLVASTKPAEADAAEALVARLAAEQSLRARLADPEALLQEHRAG